MMLKVGVTGGIGSGKTLVCSIFSAMGFPVFNADLEARQIIDTEANVIHEIKILFGEDIYIDGFLDRKRVSSIVFEDSMLLNRLNAIVHPTVVKHFIRWIEQFRHRALVVLESAILFESGAYKQVEKSVAVTAPLDTRVQRVIARDGVSADAVLRRIENQLPQEVMARRCNFIINNNQEQLLLPQVVTVVKELTNEKE